MGFAHHTVLKDEAVALLSPGAGRLIVDGTLGGGGHSEALLQAGASVIGIDRDPQALAAATERLKPFGDRFRAVKGDFGDFATLVPGQVDGLLLDLGVSSPQLDQAERGFSFQHDGPLDMRMSDEGQTAAELIEVTDENELADLIFKLGEERFSRRIAAELKTSLPKTTKELSEAVQRAVPRRFWPDKIHVATRTFQALRMTVNRELDVLDQALKGLTEKLRPNGVAAIITFHSLEDRMVKQAFRELCGDIPDTAPRGLPVMPTPEAPAPFESLTRKPLTAGSDELDHNHRARSAKLRAIRRAS